MRFTIICLAAALFGAPLSLFARDGEGLLRASGEARTLYGESVGIKVQSTLPSEQRFIESLLAGPTTGDGGGGDLFRLCDDNACSIQCTYEDPVDGNGVLMVWNETSFSASVSVLFNGKEVCKVPGLSQGQLPGINSCVVTNLHLTCTPKFEGDPSCASNVSAACLVDPTTPAGQRGVNLDLFEIRGASGTIGTQCQEILPAPPMASKLALCIRSNSQAEQCFPTGTSAEAIRADHFGCNPLADDGDCDIIVTGGHQGPPPSFLEMQLDGVSAGKELLSATFCFEKSIPVQNKGSHTVSILGYLDRDQAASQFWFDQETLVNYQGLVGAFLVPETRFTYNTSCGLAPPSKSYVPGNCNGDGDRPDVSDAIFGLTFLFIGGVNVPCEAACESNGQGEFDLSDCVHLLTFLFLGGQPPAGWQDPNGDGAPNCISPPAAADCAASHARCQ